MASFENEVAPKFAPFLGMGGIAFAMIFGCKMEHTPSHIRSTTPN
jgi:hypothetical protein